MICQKLCIFFKGKRYPDVTVDTKDFLFFYFYRNHHILEIANLENYDIFYKICLVGVETIRKNHHQVDRGYLSS